MIAKFLPFCGNLMVQDEEEKTNLTKAAIVLQVILVSLFAYFRFISFIF